MGYRAYGGSTDPFKIFVVVVGLALFGLFVVIIAASEGCDLPSYAYYSDDDDDDSPNVRSGSRGHSRGYYHGGKY